MRVGINLGFVMARFSAAERVAYVQEAERLGLASLWTGESTGMDGATQLAWAAAQTSTIGLGSAVMQMPGRSPGALAMAAISLDRLSEGRFTLGVGTTTPVVAADWHGDPWEKPVTRTREYVHAVRLALDGERVSVDGEYVRLPRTGRAMRAQEKTVQSPLPLVLAGLGAPMTRLAGEVADGWMPNHVSASYVAGARSWLEEGAQRVGRELPDVFPTYVNLVVGIGDTVEAGRDLARPILGVYFGMGTTIEASPYNQLVRRHGFVDEADEIWARFHEGDIEGAQAALSDELLDAVAICGTVESVRTRLAEYEAVGVTDMVCFCQPEPGADPADVLRRLAAACGPG